MGGDIESGVGLGVPGGPARCQGAFPLQAMGDQDEPTEEARQGGRGAGNGRGRPLALGLDSQMGTHLLEGDFHLPAAQVPGEDGLGGQVGIGAQQGLGFPAAGRVPQQDPAQGDGGLAGVVPEGHARSIGQVLLRPVGPGLGQRGPARGRVLQTVLRGGLACAHPAGTAFLARAPRRGRIMQDRIQAQPGQEGDGRGQALAGGQQPQGRVGPGPRRPPTPGRAASGATYIASGGPSP